MKKSFLTVLLAGCVLTSSILAGCGSSSAPAETETATEETDQTATISKEENVGEVDDQESAQDISYIPMELNKEVTNDFMSVTINKVRITHDLLPSDTSSTYSYKESDDDKSFMFLDGTFKNTGTRSEVPGNSIAELVFDDKYIYSGHVFIEDNNFLSEFYGVDPFASNRLVICADIPEELLDSFSSMEFHWAFADEFGAAGEDQYTPTYHIEDCTNFYKLKVSGQKQE